MKFLKSNMDRFIDFSKGVNHHGQNFLKSNMDRFIERKHTQVN